VKNGIKRFNSNSTEENRNLKKNFPKLRSTLPLSERLLLKRGPGTRENVGSKRINLEGNTHAQ
jgi:hypothetical protein